jgi:hypothetical protein
MRRPTAVPYLSFDGTGWKPLSVGRRSRHLKLSAAGGALIFVTRPPDSFGDVAAFHHVSDVRQHLMGAVVKSGGAGWQHPVLNRRSDPVGQLRSVSGRLDTQQNTRCRLGPYAYAELPESSGFEVPLGRQLP